MGDRGDGEQFDEVLDDEANDDAAMQRAHEVLAAASSVSFLTGAGISTDSGIPDFRGPNGVWTRDPEAEKRSTIAHYLSDPQVRRDAWRIRATTTLLDASPNAGHDAITELDRAGRLHTLVTQNIDGLHVLSGTDPERVVEIHGTVHRWECTDCGARGPMDDAIARVHAGELDPPCPVCGGIMKSATILFGQSLVAADLERAERAAREAEVLVAVGTSLTVYPVAGMVDVAVANGRAVVIVNAEPTPYDHVAAAVVRGSVSTVLPRILAPLGP